MLKRKKERQLGSSQQQIVNKFVDSADDMHPTELEAETEPPAVIMKEPDTPVDNKLPSVTKGSDIGQSPGIQPREFLNS